MLFFLCDGNIIEPCLTFGCEIYVDGKTEGRPIFVVTKDKLFAFIKNKISPSTTISLKMSYITLVPSYCLDMANGDHAGKGYFIFPQVTAEMLTRNKAL